MRQVNIVIALVLLTIAGLVRTGVEIDFAFKEMKLYCDLEISNKRQVPTKDQRSWDEGYFAVCIVFWQQQNEDYLDNLYRLRDKYWKYNSMKFMSIFDDHAEVLRKMRNIRYRMNELFQDPEVANAISNYDTLIDNFSSILDLARCISEKTADVVDCVSDIVRSILSFMSSLANIITSFVHTHAVLFAFVSFIVIILLIVQCLYELNFMRLYIKEQTTMTYKIDPYILNMYIENQCFQRLLMEKRKKEFIAKGLQLRLNIRKEKIIDIIEFI